MKTNTLSALLLLCLYSFAQKSSSATFIKENSIFNTDVFIENKGQYNRVNSALGPIHFAIDDNGPLIYFTPKGIIYEYKRYKYTHAEEMVEELQELNRQNQEAFSETRAKEIAEINAKLKDPRQISYVYMEFKGANGDVTIQTSNKTGNYYTYGDASTLSYGYKSILYKNIYANIDIEYSIDGDKGLHYVVYAHKGANIADIQMKFSGDLKEIQLNETKKQFQFVVDQYVFKEYGLMANYKGSSKDLQMNYSLFNNTIFFTKTASIIDRELIIDPWIQAVSTLGGTAPCTDRAYDVEYDSEGKTYIFGGGECPDMTISVPRTALYDATGAHLWTFMGTIASPIIWSSISDIEPCIANFTVDKINKKVYLAQSFAPSVGVTCIRLNASGVYDNWITIPNLNLNEGWCLFYNCKNGQLLITGGSTASDSVIAELDPVSGEMKLHTFFDNPGGFQDLMHSVSDDNGSIYTIVAPNGSVVIENNIYKLDPDLNGYVWKQNSGYLNFSEVGNKPYTTVSSNGFNCLAVNNTNVFYYDGLNVKAFDKNTGSPIGTATTVSGHTEVMQGGIIADDCNHIFVGGNNGNIKVFQFDGTTFNPAPDIVLSGFTGKEIHDLQFNKADDLIYFAGNKIVGTVKSPFTCAAPVEGFEDSIALFPCEFKAVAYIVNSIAGSYTYQWTDSSTGAVIRNYTGNVNSDTLSNLDTGKTYALLITKELFCGGVNTLTYFKINPCKEPINVESLIKVPDAFTPNGDGNNDYFKPELKGNISISEFSIFNRWGEQVFTSDGSGPGWDGRFKGAYQNLGVYTYLIKAVDNDSSQSLIKKGNVTLIK